VAETRVEGAIRAAEADSPRDGLRAIAALRRRLEELEARHVENAFRAGWSWRQIADALGVTKQAVHKKHARRVNEKLEAEGGRDRKQVIVTGQARQSVRFAREEAVACGQTSVGPVDLLLGLLRDAGGAVARALGSAGVSLDDARRCVEELRPNGRGSAQKHVGDAEKLPVSRETREVFEQSLREAVRRGDAHLGVEHLLLALLREEDGLPARTLASLGVPAAGVEALLDRALARE
jgi:hypothetical protein